MTVIGDEVKIAATIMDTALLDFIGTHRKAHGSGIGGARQTVDARAGSRPPDAEARMSQIYTVLIRSPPPELRIDGVAVRLTDRASAAATP
jgi:hypothetical protein